MKKKFAHTFLATLSMSVGMMNSSQADVQKPAVTIQGVGYIEPIGQVLCLNFKNLGIISEICVNINQQVKKGALLAKQSNSEELAMLAAEQSAVELAQSELKQLQAGVNPAKIKQQETTLMAKKESWNYAKLREQRLLNLSASNSVPAADKDLAVSEAKRSDADLKASEAELQYLHDYVRPVDISVALAHLHIAEAKLKLQKARLAQTELLAPSDGTVLEIFRQVGEMTDHSEPVILLADVNHLQVRAELDENYALQLHVGQQALIYSRGDEHQAIKGMVTDVKPIMGKKTVFAKTVTERKDVDVRQVFVRLPERVNLPIGMETDVIIEPDNQ